MIDRARQSVSLCMIVRNESHNLPACIEAVRPIVNEMIIVDTGSTDGTQQIAASLGAKVVPFPWCDDFSAARNESLRHASGDYILWLDADDRIDAENVERLRELIRSLDGTRQAFVFEVLCKVPQELPHPMLECQPRLFRACPSAAWNYRVHEQVLPGLQRLGYGVQWPGIRIEHEGYVDPELVRRKAVRNLRLCRIDYAVTPDDPAVLYHLGKEVWRLGNAREALGWMLKSLQFAERQDRWVARVYLDAIALLSALGRKSEALNLARDGLTWFADCLGLALAEAELLCDLGKFAQARPALERLSAARAPSSFDLAAPVRSVRDRARNLLGLTHLHLQNLTLAEELFLAAVAENPSCREAWTWLGFVHLAQGRGAELAEDVSRLQRLPGGEPFALCLEAEMLKLRGMFETGLERAEAAVEVAPAMPLARMLVAELLAATAAPIERRRAALNDVLRLAPGNRVAMEQLKRLDAASQFSAQQLFSTVTVGEDCPLA